MSSFSDFYAHFPESIQPWLPWAVGFVIAIGLALVIPFLQNWWPRQRVVRQDDGTYIRHIYPTAATGWLPVLGHALKMVSPNGVEWVKDNFKGHKRPFYIELLGKRIVQLSGPTFHKAFVRAPDSQLCSKLGNSALFNFEISFGSLDMLHRPFQIKAIRTTFVELRKTLVPKIQSLIEEALEGLFPTLRVAGDCTTVAPLHATIFDMIGTILSVILVGDKIGRNKDMVKAMKALTSVINRLTFDSKALPKFMIDKSGLDSLKTTMHECIEPEVRARRREGSSNHGDFLQILIESKDQDGNVYTAETIANRMLGIVFATFDTTSSALTNLLLDLASPSNTACKQKVFEEVESIWALGPMSQQTVSQMTYTKACLYESLRRSQTVVGAPLRMVLHDFCVPLGKGKDGIEEVAVIPKGAIASYSNVLAHQDESNFQNPNVFDPETNQLSKSQLDVSKNSVVFGLGRHSCPGRFFAVEEVQTAMIVLMRNFDFSVETDYEPKTLQGTPVVSDLPVKVTLKKEGELMLNKLRSSSKIKAN